MKRAILLILLLSLQVSIAQEPQGNRGTAGESAFGNRAETLPAITRLNKSSELIGTEVRNAQNERLGEVKDMMFSLGQDRISFVVLGTGGFLGIGDKLIALPPTAFAHSPDGKTFILNADKEALRGAPGFEQNNWPAMADFSWLSGQETDYAVAQHGKTIEEAAGAESIRPKLQDKTNDLAPPESQTKAKESPANLRATDLIGTTVRNPEGQKLGDVKDAAVDLSSGSIRYLVISTGGVLGVGEKLFAIAPQEFQRSAADKTLVLDATRETFKTASGFDRENWPVTADRTFSRAITDPAGSSRTAQTDGRTAIDQGNTRRDLMITQQLRRAILRDETMSVLTRNITIITADERITVRGVVASQEEVEKILSFAREIAGNKVTNELQVQNEQGGNNETTETNEQ